MVYLNLDCDYFDHPKTRRLIGLLGRGSEVLPIKLWAYCGKYHAESGRLVGYGAQEIESIIGWWGKDGQAVEAMLKTLWITKEDDGFTVHDWAEYQGHIHALRVRGQKGARARWDAIRIAASNAQASNKQSPIPPTLPTYLPPERVGGNVMGKKSGDQVRERQKQRRLKA